ncbi:hypothetical protein [Phaeovulum sp. W22_SRMD_FR3]|uniref:hypothetical protein n=1 Tax=Phaeovulum sp. W22_SRMD_FR3 TaxID=3240274 RepID=UPI003F999C69
MVEDIYRKICVESPLYAAFKFNEHFREISSDEKYDILVDLMKRDIQFDCYCVRCEQEATFQRWKYSAHLTDFNFETQTKFSPATFFVHMRCTRRDHLFTSVFSVVKDGIVKIGMYPSMEDIASSDLKKYRGVLDRKYFSELHRASGLASHGIGIGSFVYLRRIFESLILSHFERYEKKNGTIDGFQTLRMDEKISSIAEFLPDGLVKHRKIYAILSKGIHELDESFCLEVFPVLKKGIMLILEQDLQIQEQEKASAALDAEMQKIMQEMPNAIAKN